VQAPFPLTGNSAVLLTIAKYYTPSGRLIQRDYAHQGLYEYLNRNEGEYDLKDMKKTDGGRSVFGGDGIAPDERYDAPKATRLQARIINRSVFFFFAPQYFAKHDVRLNKDWQPDEALLENFRSFITERGVDFTPAEFERDRTWIRNRLREELFITAFSKEESDRLVLQNDPELAKAVDSLPSSKALFD